MKKYLSFILTICILLGCASLISCNFEGIFGKTSSSTEGTEPAPSEPTQPSEQSTQPTEPTQSTTQPTEPFVEEVDEKLKLQIIEYYLIVSGIQSDKKPEEIECEFYGKYGESVAVYFYTSGAYETSVWETVAEYNFFYRDSRTIKIWNNRKFYSMSEAFELGLINSENVKTIYLEYRNLEFRPPYFIYKHDYEFNWDMYYQIISQENFWCIAPGQICVGLDHGISSYQKDFNFEFFQGIDYEYIEDITFEHRLDPDELPEGFEKNLHLHYVIHLKDKSEEAIFEAISIIEKMDGINFVEPVYWFYPNSGDYRSAPNDPFYFDDSTPEITENDQWGLNNIEMKKVW